MRARGGGARLVPDRGRYRHAEWSVGVFQGPRYVGLSTWSAM